MSSYYTYEGNLRDRNKFTSTVNTTFGTKRYFSQLDTEVYFGSEQIDEMVAIDFTISEPKLPIYGFNSFYANRIVSGRRTIQGTFAINFTSTIYLLNILNKIDDSILKAAYNAAGSDVYLDYESLIYRCEGEDTTGLGIGNNALFSKIFDITLSYGYGKTEGMQTYNSCYQTLLGVQIVDYRQALDTEGNPILDMYSFIAKDIRYIDADMNTSIDSSTTTDDSTTTQDPTVEEPSVEETEPIYEVGNYLIENDRKNVTSKCQNSTIPGYLITPTFNYTPPGHYAGSAYPYLRIEIDSLNDSNVEFTNASIFIFDQVNGLNTTINLKNIKNNDNRGVLHEFKDSTRDLGIDLRNFYTDDPESYKAQCVIKFTTKIGEKEVEVSCPTILFLGSTLN